MEELRSQVGRARRRLALHQFLATVVWWLFGALLVAVLGIAASKIWVMSVDKTVWLWSWFGGAAFAGVAGAAIWTYIVRRSHLDAAIEIDRRFGFKERVSSTLSLAPEERTSEAGQALVQDATRRVSRVEISERFPVQTNWKMLLPFVPAAAVFALALLVPDAIQQQANAAASTKSEIETAKERHSNLRERLKKQRKQMEQEGLKDADSIFKQIEESLGDVDLNKDGVSKKKALIELKDLAKKLGDRRDMANSAKELKNQLKKLANSTSGPADELAKAMRQGDFAAAKKALQDLGKKIAEGKLTKEQKQNLTKQMQQIKKNLNQLTQKQQDAKQQLEEKIKQMKQAGDQNAVEQLQQQLDKLAQQDQMMSQLEQMAQQMKQAADAMQKGDQQGASQQMAQMMQDFQKLQDQLDELESLDDLMDDLADVRDSMNCKNCNGAGCQQCQGMGQGGQGNGNGLGEGQGRGQRPEEESDTSGYRSKVGAKPRAGESVLKGFTSGPNLPGVSTEDIKTTIQQNISTSTDSLTDQRLPRDQRDHTKDYFDRLKK